jgi:hypothetical protein
LGLKIRAGGPLAASDDTIRHHGDDRAGRAAEHETEVFRLGVFYRGRVVAQEDRAVGR